MTTNNNNKPPEAVATPSPIPQDAFETLQKENSEQNRLLNLIKAELAQNPTSSGLSVIGGIKALNNKLYCQETLIRELNAKLVVLENRLNNSKSEIIKELIRDYK